MCSDRIGDGNKVIRNQPTDCLLLLPFCIKWRKKRKGGKGGERRVVHTQDDGAIDWSVSWRRDRRRPSSSKMELDYVTTKTIELNETNDSQFNSVQLSQWSKVNDDTIAGCSEPYRFVASFHLRRHASLPFSENCVTSGWCSVVLI